ncbi:MAG: universal stress protein [Candidatus Marinimicrobia bacterium CG08_land_8_20_14_0_20_45_22]|nr:MAG: universal stress protein [Candidatus Marinimicrobia bacterium CG08_land_8_20_14_0_20_45_22]
MLPIVPINRILVYLDGSEGCVLAAKYAIVLSKITHAQIKAIYIVNTNLLKQLSKARIFVKVEEMDYERDLEEDGRRYLKHVKDLGERKGVSIETELLKGAVHVLAVQKIKEWEANLFVMGELEPILTSSDAFHDEAGIIFRKAPCSVLVVKNAPFVEQVYNSII